MLLWAHCGPWSRHIYSIRISFFSRAALLPRSLQVLWHLQHDTLNKLLLSRQIHRVPIYGATAEHLHAMTHHFTADVHTLCRVQYSAFPCMANTPDCVLSRGQQAITAKVFFIVPE